MSQAHMIFRVGHRYGKAVVKLGRVVSPRVVKFGRLASVEMAPPSIKEFVGEVRKLKDVDPKAVVARLGDLSINEIAARGLVLAELGLIFYVGECFGRESWVGYNFKGYGLPDME